jgi:hypothetical protein
MRPAIYLHAQGVEGILDIGGKDTRKIIDVVGRTWKILHSLGLKSSSPNQEKQNTRMQALAHGSDCTY